MKKHDFISITKMILILALFCMASTEAYSTPIVISGGTNNDIIGRTCRMPNGNLISIVERNPDWGSGDLYAILSLDNGDSWGLLKPIITDPGNQSTLSVIVSPNDSIVLFYASNETGYYKIYAISSIDGVTWSNKHQVDLGWTATQQIYDPMVIVEEDNSYTMVYVAMGGGAYIANCPYEGSWDVDKTFVQSGAYRVSICKNNDTYLIAYHRNISGNYDIHVKSSTDRINWSNEVDLTSNGNSHDAFCNITPGGRYMIYYAKHFPSAYNIHTQVSDDGINWYEEEAITMDAVNNTQPSFFIEGTTLYLSWTHAIDYDTDNDIYIEKFDYNYLSQNEIETVDPFIYYDHISGNIIIENMPSNKRSTLMITDMLGREYYSNELNSTTDKYIINGSNYLKKGSYIFSLVVENRRYTKKFIVVN